MSTNDDNPYRNITIAGMIVGLALVAVMFVEAVREKPSIEYQIHKSELVNWWGGS